MVGAPPRKALEPAAAPAPGWALLVAGAGGAATGCGAAAASAALVPATRLRREATAAEALASADAAEIALLDAGTTVATGAAAGSGGGSAGTSAGTAGAAAAGLRRDGARAAGVGPGMVAGGAGWPATGKVSNSCSPGMPEGVRPVRNAGVVSGAGGRRPAALLFRPTARERGRGVLARAVPGAAEAISAGRGRKSIIDICTGVAGGGGGGSGVCGAGAGTGSPPLPSDSSSRTGLPAISLSSRSIRAANCERIQSILNRLGTRRPTR